MKFNWGTGILVFLILFLMACAAFIIFALRQDVNLVHRDYYEKGVDYTDQMNVNARSVDLADSVQIRFQNEYLFIEFQKSLVEKIDSGKVLFFRPSDSGKDKLYPMNFTDNGLVISNQYLVPGRYILKLSWYTHGLKYEIDKQVNIQ